MELALKDHLGNAGTGVTRYTKDKETYIRALSEMGLLDAMAEIVNRPCHGVIFSLNDCAPAEGRPFVAKPEAGTWRILSKIS